MKMDNLPYIKVDFTMEGKNFNLEELTEILDILPTETRGLNDWPEAIKNNLDLPEELRPRCVWSICQEDGLCSRIETPINIIVSQLEGKEQKLIEFCKRYNLKKSLGITIQAEAMNLPEIALSQYIVSYFGKLEVEIGFDMYIY